ncbi:hypothetical protein [Clostridium paridis]|uniref:Lipoprotein n=1 Tax=Clostridium paridis TaxID=2803863 RepID=A0A937K3R4_9CLOT|nr:hypothetical protein [Clostridium paridis]MBL4932651.1 hypothetical protein [Clostridium paridis]
MKNKSILKKAIIPALVLGITASILTGCQSKNNSNNNKQANGKGYFKQGGQRMDPEERKKQMQTNIDALVADGIITKDQGTKILEALTSNTRNQNGQANNSNQDNNNNNNNNNNSNNNSENGNKNRQRFNPLSKLVSDGVITQDQADKVLQKVMGNFQRGNNQPTTS